MMSRYFIYICIVHKGDTIMILKLIRMLLLYDFGGYLFMLIPIVFLFQRGLEQIIESADIEDDFLKLFWSEQKKAAGRDPRGMRWHPMMIR